MATSTSQRRPSRLLASRPAPSGAAPSGAAPSRPTPSPTAPFRAAPSRAAPSRAAQSGPAHNGPAPSRLHPPATGQSSVVDSFGQVTELLRIMNGLPCHAPARAELRDRAIAAGLPLARRLALRFAGRGERVDDLSQVATIGLIKAVDRFEPGRGLTFGTFAVPTIVGEIKRHFRDRGWMIRVGRRLQQLHLDINGLQPRMTQELGRVPTPAELAARLGVDEADVRAGMACARAYAADSLSAPVNDESDVDLAEMLGAPDERLESVADRHTLRQALACLPGREQRILGLRFFDNKTQSEIAVEVGVSQMHVSRLLTRALGQLRELMMARD